MGKKNLKFIEQKVHQKHLFIYLLYKPNAKALTSNFTTLSSAILCFAMLCYAISHH